MTEHHILLALAAIALIGVVIAQDYLWKPLRQESISAGLTGPFHWYLVGSMVLLAATIALSFRHGTVVQQVLAYGSAVSLTLTAASGTYTTKLGANGEKIHAALTACTFVLALALQVVSNDHSAGMWGMTGLGVAASLGTHFLVPTTSVTEKVGVLGLCAWLVAWAL